MKIETTFKISIIASCALLLVYWFAPWFYGYLDSETQQILSWGGYKSALSVQNWFWNIFLFFSIISYVGIFLLRKVFRTLFLVIVISSLALSSVSGMSVITGFEVLIIDASTMLNGFIIAIAYFSELKSKFY